MLFFEGKQFLAIDTVVKIRHDSLDWFLAQSVEQKRTQLQGEGVENQVRIWKPPPIGWLMCNVATSWNSETGIGGGAWVLRDHLGRVLMHNRKAFEVMSNIEEFKLEGLLWAMRSMNDHNLLKVVFGSRDSVLIEAVNRPKAWPSYKFQVSKILEILCKFQD